MEHEMQCSKEDYQEFQSHLQRLIQLSDQQKGFESTMGTADIPDQTTIKSQSFQRNKDLNSTLQMSKQLIKVSEQSQELNDS